MSVHNDNSLSTAWNHLTEGKEHPASGKVLRYVTKLNTWEVVQLTKTQKILQKLGIDKFQTFDRATKLKLTQQINAKRSELEDRESIEGTVGQIYQYFRDNKLILFDQKQQHAYVQNILDKNLGV